MLKTDALTAPDDTMAPPPAETAAPPRLAFVDGLRGIAAFIVMAGHALRQVPGMPADHALYSFRLASWWERAVWPITFGNQMVALFIFISGFSLYYSEARRRERKGPTPLATYAGRRLWRILPVYYVALFFAMAVIALVPSLQAGVGQSIYAFAPVTWQAFAAHLVSLHHLSPTWMYRINPPLWSIPVEAQLYLVFPLLMLAMRRLTPLVGTAVALGAYWWARGAIDLTFVKFFEEFAVGMLTAHVAMKWPRRVTVPLAVAGLAALFLAVSRGPDNFDVRLWLPGFVGLVLACYTLPVGRWNPPTWRPVRAIGTWSYSLYAIHFPLLLLLYAGIRGFGWSPPIQAVFMVVVGSAVSVGAAWVLYQTVERFSLRRIHGPTEGHAGR